MKARLFISAAICAALPLTLTAQQPRSGYHTVACFKVKSGKGAEIQQWLAGDVHKLQQANADSGRISTWFLLRSIMPQGSSASCDYYGVAVFPGLMPAPMGAEEMGAALKRAGVTASAQESLEKRDALLEAVSYELWQNRITVGTIQKGGYMFLNRMKVESLNQWIETERKIWQPLAEHWVGTGDMTGWFLNTAVLPGGSELKYQAATVDCFPTWEAAMNYPVNAVDAFKKVHPGKDFDYTFEYLKMRNLAVRELLLVADLVVPAK